MRRPSKALKTLKRLSIAYVVFSAFTLVGLMQKTAFTVPGNFAAVMVVYHRFAALAAFPFWQGPMKHHPQGMVLSAFCGPLIWLTLCIISIRTTRSILYFRRRRALAKLPAGESLPLSPSRRRFLRFGAYTVPSLAVASSSYALGFSAATIKVRRYDFPIRNLPAPLHGLRIAHLSDFHSGACISLEYLRSAMEQKPDVVFVTGDFVSDRLTFDAVAELVSEELVSHLGILCTLGNHDHWQGASKARRAFAKVNVPLIDNQRRFLTRDGIFPEPQPDCICIAGIGDAWEDVMDYNAALGGVDPDMPRIVLSHNPDSAEFFVEHGGAPPRIDLMLCGHTHGGQVYIPGIGSPIVPSNYGQKYVGGLVQGPHWPVIVSRGLGVISPPVRFLVPPELSIITLNPDSATRSADLRPRY